MHPNNPANQNPQFAAEVFDAAIRPHSWLRTARRLRSSADAIFKKEDPIARKFWAAAWHATKTGKQFNEMRYPFPNFDAAYMLIAFSIENLLKGLLIAKKLVTFDSKNSIPSNLRTHDLEKLERLASPIARLDKHSLYSLTYMSEWRGRYPMPTKVDKFWPMHDDGKMKTPGLVPEDHAKIFSYCDQLESELTRLLAD
ncbi:MAG TPA: hypothetical protein VHY35_21285 [Stellaceae bacterium]|jgi:hypothetical protein|nr:hypothetical protein [Stellaceae bacterium]